MKQTLAKPVDLLAGSRRTPARICPFRTTGNQRRKRMAEEDQDKDRLFLIKCKRCGHIQIFISSLRDMDFIRVCEKCENLHVMILEMTKFKMWRTGD